MKLIFKLALYICVFPQIMHTADEALNKWKKHIDGLKSHLPTATPEEALILNEWIQDLESRPE